MKSKCPTNSVFCAMLLGCVFLAGELVADSPLPARRRRDDGRGPRQSQVDYRAHDMLRRGTQFLEQDQIERGLNILSSIPDMFPESPVRFDAYLAMGVFRSERRDFDLAINLFRLVSDSEDEMQQAEALYRIGICHYNMNNFDRAFVALRRVTNDYPGSVFANEAYYYIGQCHFQLGNWTQAVEALKMVGTSVPQASEARLAESGQRLYVKIEDKDLVVLKEGDGTFFVEATTQSGDRERILMETLGRQGDYYIGSIQTALGTPVPGDDMLQFRGLEEVAITYVDENTETGERHVKRTQDILLVSTATVGFTDGAYREHVQGVFVDSDCFVRVRDLDRSATAQTDIVEVRIYTRYKVEKEDEPVLGGGVDLGASQEDEWQIRDTIQLKLTESDPDSGIFIGGIVPRLGTSDQAVDQADDVLIAVQGDEIVVEYLDEHHIHGDGPRLTTFAAKILVGEIQDVKIIHRVVDSLDLQARKNLIEAKIYLRLGQIFKDVGLIDQASDRAELGLERADQIISASAKGSLERQTVEEAFMVKWELLLVQDKINQAIQVCQTLTRLFPDSSLVDQALLKIAQVKMEGERPEDAIPILNGILRLPRSELKAEAQFSIARVHEEVATRAAKGQGRTPDLSRSLLAFQKCAETYPESNFAGDALEKIVNFYISAKDYARAVELMERIFVDYPDASFLDSMLLKWVIAAYRMGNYESAHGKARQLLSQYPNSNHAARAQQFLEVIERRL